MYSSFIRNSKGSSERGDRILLSGAGADEIFLGYHRYNSRSLAIDQDWLIDWWMKAGKFLPSFVLTKDWYLKASTYVLGIAGYTSNILSTFGSNEKNYKKGYRTNMLRRIQNIGRYVLANNPYKERSLRKSWLDIERICQTIFWQ